MFWTVTAQLKVLRAWKEYSSKPGGLTPRFSILGYLLPWGYAHRGFQAPPTKDGQQTKSLVNVGVSNDARLSVVLERPFVPSPEKSAFGARDLT
ncbi:hypothetical protein GGS20DRAFT_589602 [Poronia punctata]|nr:hypothetical protein GGS20DRAFT_589602 [Poronia punctata]